MDGNETIRGRILAMMDASQTFAGGMATVESPTRAQAEEAMAGLVVEGYSEHRGSFSARVSTSAQVDGAGRLSSGIVTGAVGVNGPAIERISVGSREVGVLEGAEMVLGHRSFESDMTPGGRMMGTVAFSDRHRVEADHVFMENGRLLASSPHDHNSVVEIVGAKGTETSVAEIVEALKDSDRGMLSGSLELSAPPETAGPQLDRLVLMSATLTPVAFEEEYAQYEEDLIGMREKAGRLSRLDGDYSHVMERAARAEISRLMDRDPITSDALFSGVGGSGYDMEEMSTSVHSRDGLIHDVSWSAPAMDGGPRAHGVVSIGMEGIRTAEVKSVMSIVPVMVDGVKEGERETTLSYVDGNPGFVSMSRRDGIDTDLSVLATEGSKLYAVSVNEVRMAEVTGVSESSGQSLEDLKRQVRGFGGFAEPTEIRITGTSREEDGLVLASIDKVERASLYAARVAEEVMTTTLGREIEKPEPAPRIGGLMGQVKALAEGAYDRVMPKRETEAEPAGRQTIMRGGAER